MLDKEALKLGDDTFHERLFGPFQKKRSYRRCHQLNKERYEMLRMQTTVGSSMTHSLCVTAVVGVVQCWHIARNSVPGSAVWFHSGRMRTEAMIIIARPIRMPG
jgi:hypothetical protein